MAPVYVKGGIWTNVEDEILKASISKYGLNQWARVSSLLAKKTAKQCKARWNEWLHPNIRKIEWSKEEDEKLLRTVKLLPNQWRSIAPIVGRTPTQCIERYQHLLDEANKEFSGENNELGLQGPGIESMEAVGRSVQVGDLHLNPESKPARPDAEDMDDEEREMLSEARARLANTMGKKAKRKARERMLEETRRISLLQKRRELKNAGINMKLKRKKKDDDKHIDYNAEIPVYQAPQVGFYDTAGEIEKNNREQKAFEAGVRKHGTKNIEFEKQLNKEKRNREVQPSMEQNEKLKSDEVVGFKRRKLVMPEPETAVSGSSKSLPAPMSTTNDLLKAARSIQQKSEAQSSLLGAASQVVADEEEEEEFDRYEDELDAPSKPAFDIKSRLASLPAPKNNYDDIVMDESLSESEQELEEEPGEQESVDQGEILRRKELAAREEYEKSLLRRSQVLQKALPIPNLDSGLNFESTDEVRQLIDQEMVNLIRSDYAKANGDMDNTAIIPDLDEHTFAAIKAQVNDEVANSSITLPEFKSQILPRLSALSGLPGLSDTTPSSKQIQSLVDELKSTAAKSAKLEKKFLVLNGGYVKRFESLAARSRELQQQIFEADVQLKTYKAIQAMEQVAIENRTHALQESVDLLVDAESVGQRRYDDLTRI